MLGLLVLLLAIPTQAVTAEYPSRKLLQTQFPLSFPSLRSWSLSPTTSFQKPQSTGSNPSTPSYACSSSDNSVSAVLSCTNAVRDDPKKYSSGFPCADKSFLNTLNRLPPLQHADSLNRAAQVHSDEMARYNYMAHEGRDGSTPTSRMKAAGFQGTVYGENVARGFNSALDVVGAWMCSKAHRDILFHPKFTHLGVGIARSGSVYYHTQNFGKAA